MKTTRRLLALIIAILLLWQVLKLSLIPTDSQLVFVFFALIVSAFILIIYSLQGFLLSKAGSIQDLKWGEKVQILSVKKQGKWYYYTVKKKNGKIRLMRDKYYYSPDEQFYVYTWNGKLTLYGRMNTVISSKQVRSQY